MALNWLDIIIILIIILICLDSMYKGLLASLINLVGMLVSLYVAKIITPVIVSVIINTTPIYKNLKLLFDKKATTMNKGVLSFLKLVNIKDESVGGALANILINLGCFIVLFLICYFLINIFRDTLKSIINRTPIKYIDRLGGLIIGIIKSCILLFIFFAFITPIIGLLPQNEALVNAIGTSKLARYFYMYNFIIPWMQSMIHL